MNQEQTSQLTDDIDTVVWNASNQIEAVDQRSFIRANIPAALKLLIVVPLLAVCAQCLRWACWLSAGAFVSWTTSIILTCAVPLIWLFAKVATRQAAVSRQRALRATDQQLGSSERIVTADHFLQQPSRNGFMQAAVEDATAWAIRGRDAKLDQTPARGPDFRRSIWPIPVAIAGLLLASFLTQFERTNVADDPVPPGVTRLADNSSITQTPARPQRKPEPQEQEPANERPDSPRDPRSRRAVNRQGSAGAAIPDNAEESRGKLNEGETRESQQSANPSSARGAPSASGQPSKAGDETKRKPKKKQKETTEKEREQKQREQDEKPSGATAGQGSSKGSDNNAAPSDWASTSQAATPDDEDLEEEDEVDDEEEEQESRGGVQPNMRDRRAPVNRDLQIGFGNNRPNPDANGRGGPGGQKKSRGVASLVLGVPIPDRVNGQPNKGRIRITQQRITPEAEQSDPVAAQDRLPRNAAVGPIHHPDFSPWLQDLVRRYFLARRAKHPLKTPAKQTASSTTPPEPLQTTSVAESETPQS